MVFFVQRRRGKRSNLSPTCLLPRGNDTLRTRTVRAETARRTEMADCDGGLQLERKNAANGRGRNITGGGGINGVCKDSIFKKLLRIQRGERPRIVEFSTQCQSY